LKRILQQHPLVTFAHLQVARGIGSLTGRSKNRQERAEEHERQHQTYDKTNQRVRPRLAVRWLPVLRSSTAEGGAGNGADTASDDRIPETKAVCALTPHPPHSKTSRRSAWFTNKPIPTAITLNQFISIHNFPFSR
jgi:hypothetical protein